MDSAIQLAEDRTIFAVERTYAAWMRTGLAALASAVGARTLLKGVLPGWETTLTASVLALFSALCFVAAMWRELLPGLEPKKPAARRLPRFFLYFMNGILTLAALAVLVSVATGPR
jgi:putative membrane protein